MLRIYSPHPPFEAPVRHWMSTGFFVTDQEESWSRVHLDFRNAHEHVRQGRMISLSWAGSAPKEVDIHLEVQQWIDKRARSFVYFGQGSFDHHERTNLTHQR